MGVDTHPFLETYKNWVCESDDPSSTEISSKTRCCQPGDELTDPLCTATQFNRCSGSWTDFGPLTYAMCNNPHEMNGQCGDPNQGSIVYLNATSETQYIHATNLLMNDDVSNPNAQSGRTDACVYVIGFTEYTYEKGANIKLNIDQENLEIWEMYGGDWDKISSTPVSWPHYNASFGEAWPSADLWEAL